MRRAMNPDWATLVFGIDILVMVPEGTPSTEIRQARKRAESALYSQAR
jgi:hypothetical protein